MNNYHAQSQLDPIRTKHLSDLQSDQLYQPIRNISYEFLLHQDKPQNQKDKFYERLNSSKIPHNLQSLQISNQPINPLKKMKKIGQKIVYEHKPISQKVFQKLNRNKRTEVITYKYGTINTNQNSYTPNKKNIRILSLQNKPQNRSNFKQKLQKVNKLKNQNTQGKYNLYTIIDHPINSIIKTGLFSCGGCSNQIVAREKEITWQEQ